MLSVKLFYPLKIDEYAKTEKKNNTSDSDFLNQTEILERYLNINTQGHIFFLLKMYN